MSTKRIKKIAWLVDIYSEDRDSQFSALPWLKLLQEKTSAVIEPVYILAPGMSPIGMPKEPSKMANRRSSHIIAFKKWLKSAKDLKLSDPVVLFSKELYLRANVDTLLRYIESEAVDFTVLNTHARKGLGRIWLGSFAETLLLHSKHPLFMINPFCKPPKKLAQIIYPVLLDKNSVIVRSSLAQLVTALNCKLHLFHKVEHHFESFGYPSRITAEYKVRLKEHVLTIEKKLKEWCGFFQERGLKVTSSVDVTASGVTDGILNETKRKNADIIALHTSAGSFTANIIGSTARNIVRRANTPVWVFHN